MKVKKVKLEWYIMNWDINREKIERINILPDSLKEDIAKHIRQKAEHRKIQDMQSLVDFLKTEFMWQYWSRCEYEMIVTDFYSKKEQKIDVWFQIEPNLLRIAEYINQEMQLGF